LVRASPAPLPNRPSRPSGMNLYETDKLLAEYLLFHYGTAEEILPYRFGPHDALNYPVRCITDCLDPRTLPEGARALDLGCAVGRSTFELARHARQVVGIDFSRRFIEAATSLREHGELGYRRTDEGDLGTPLVAKVSAEIDRHRVTFEVGNAMELRSDLGTFDVVLLANLIDRLSKPLLCLERMPELLRSGGHLLITSPYTWLEDFTPRQYWLGGVNRGGRALSTLDGLHTVLDGAFELRQTRDLPFLIREHARKFQWSIAQASLWRRW
jgi:putative 4-mercaptohistidine N1-methyltranferase